MSTPSAEEVVRLLGLVPHPEGGFYKETFRPPGPEDPGRSSGSSPGGSPGGGRGASTAIYYLLRENEVSAWHRVRDADEVWHHYAGGPLELTLATEGRREVIRLGADLLAGERPQAVVPAGVWQTARVVGSATGAWALMGCTVAPAFEFSAFEMAPAGWEPEC